MNAPDERLNRQRAPLTGTGHGLPWLVADVGGTNARFGWVDDPSAGVCHVHTVAVADHAGPAQAAQGYLDIVRQALGPRWSPPRRSAWAMATALEADWIALTNGHWRFSAQALQQALGVAQLRLLNDFEALALALPHLQPAQLRAHGPLPRAEGVLAVIGPGTGLGVGAVVQTPCGWTALPGEGGHMTLAATDEAEAQLLAEARRHHAHISAERLLSGIGLPLLYRCVCALAGQTPTALDAPQIVARGCAGTDAMCQRTLDAFCALLGSFAGNVALTLGARGGVFIGGGIVPRLGERFFVSRFREKFEAKGRFRSYLADIPTALITDTLAALTGAAAALSAPAGN